jgi:hypothetical protein
MVVKKEPSKASLECLSHNIKQLLGDDWVIEYKVTVKKARRPNGKRNSRK